jgi:hypothetical protein
MYNKDKWEFLSDLWTTAIENYGYGWFTVTEYRWENLHPQDQYAVIVENSTGETFRVTAQTMAKGLKKAKNPEWDEAAEECEAGDLDVVDALNILEYALFGHVVYC